MRTEVIRKPTRSTFRLRMRHNQFIIDEKAKEAWLNAMARAIDSVEISREHQAELWNYLEMAANSLVNQPT